jgi:hypothetical protein
MAKTKTTAPRGPLPSGTFRIIKIADLKVDRSYQRDLDEKRVDAMAAAFDKDLMGVPVVTLRGGDVYVIDGQHRRALAERMGVKEILCRIVVCKTVADEAQLFLDLNGLVKAVGAFAKFNARLTAREPIAIAITNVVHNAGLRLSPYKVDHAVTAVQCLEYVHTRYSNLGRVLHILTMWLDGDPSAYDGTIVKDVGAFLHEHEKANDARLVNALRDVSARELKRKTKAAKADLGGTRSEAAMRALRAIYNDGLRGKSRLDRRQLNGKANGTVKQTVFTAQA